jgi:hypothetical protein
VGYHEGYDFYKGVLIVVVGGWLLGYKDGGGICRHSFGGIPSGLMANVGAKRGRIHGSHGKSIAGFMAAVVKVPVLSRFDVY